MSDEIDGIERRRFLCVVGAAGALTAGAGCGDGEPAGPMSVGTVAEIPVGSWKRLADRRLIVGRDAAGFFAFSTVCPHEGYNVDFDGGSCAASATTSTVGNLTCCSGHGGGFNGQGVVTRGPPSTNLRHFQVTVSGADVSVNTAVSVPVSARTPA